LAKRAVAPPQPVRPTKNDQVETERVMNFRGLAQTILAAGITLSLGAVSVDVRSAKAAELQKLVVFSQPIPHYDSVWMADAKGYFRDVGLDVQFRQFASGTTALQAFKAGEGDIIFGGDFPGVQYWLENNKNYRLIAAIERDGKSYLVTANKSINKPADFKGKIVATRVGSTVDWFMSEYLSKNGLKKSDVTVKNLDGQIMPAALCNGDIDAFFFWQPYNDKAIEVCPDKAHNVSDAEGYIPGYVIAAARPDWLNNPENAKKVEAFFKAIIRGKADAAKDLDAVAAYGKEKFSMTREAVESQWKNSVRMIALNDLVYKDYCELAGWMRSEGTLKDKLDLSQFVWTDGLKAVDPASVTKPPPPC
jgi:ABC-type nitrate/sulfonate/bicarbonate transport system substrate-binding protein